MAPGRWFVRHISYPYLFPRLTHAPGRHVPQMYRHFKESERWPIERHRHNQLLHIQQLVTQAYVNCKFYRDRFDAIGLQPGDIKSLEDYAKIPPLRRRDIQEHLSDLIAVNVTEKDYTIGGTSGSTGTPLRFAIDRLRYPIVRAMLHRNQRWIGLELGDRHAYLWASFSEKLACRTRYFRFAHWILNQRFICTWDLGPEDLIAINEELCRFKPKVITGFSSTLTTYAMLIKTRNLTPPPVIGLISTGETLFPQQRQVMEEAFGCKVFNRYGDVEMGDICHECEAHDGLHINEERVYVELQSDPELPEGICDFIVTDLNNSSMPFIRYQTEDLGRWHSDPEGCACGRPLRRVAEVQGRRYDVIKDRNGVPVNGLVFEDWADATAGIAQFQCVQKTPERLLFRVVAIPGHTAEQIREGLIERSKRSIGPDRFEINVELVDEIAPTKSGKLRQIVSEVDSVS